MDPGLRAGHRSDRRCRCDQSGGQGSHRIARLLATAHLSRVRAVHRIGLLQQSLDATAGLLGTTVALLLSRPELAAHLIRSRIPACEPVAEVARSYPSGQNTRRFAAESLRLMEQPIEAGQGVLLVPARQPR